MKAIAVTEALKWRSFLVLMLAIVELRFAEEILDVAIVVAVIGDVAVIFVVAIVVAITRFDVKIVDQPC